VTDGRTLSVAMRHAKTEDTTQQYTSRVLKGTGVRALIIITATGEITRALGNVDVEK